MGTLVDRTYGTAIGDMTALGGLAAAFDGNNNQSRTLCAGKDAAATAYIGKDWGAGVARTIDGFGAYGSNDYGFKQAYNPTITITLQGSTDNFSSSIVDLGNVSGTDANGLHLEKLTGITTTTAYRYHRLKIVDGGGDTTQWLLCAEVEFYEIPGWSGKILNISAPPKILGKAKADVKKVLNVS